MPFSPSRRLWLSACAAGLLSACASSGPDPLPEPPPDAELASLPLRVLMTQDFADAHRALESRLMLPVQARTVSGNGTVPVVTQQLAGHLQEGAAADVVVAPRAVMEQLLAQRLVRRDSLIDVLRTPLVALVQAGRSLPPLQTEAELRQLLLRTPSLAYPSSDGSDFIEKKLLPQLGIQARMLPKSIKVFGPRVSQLVAAGEAELGLQSLSALAGSKGVSVIGPLPAPWSYDTVYTAAATMHGNSLAGAQALLRFYQREAAQHNWAGSGWEVLAQPAQAHPQP